jgi:hypothetical protein
MHKDVFVDNINVRECLVQKTSWTMTKSFVFLTDNETKQNTLLMNRLRKCGFIYIGILFNHKEE